MSDNKTEVFAPYRCAATFADGSRLTFDGITREQARSAMEAATEEHGDFSWWNWVTDENYRGGEYHLLTPPPPVLPFPVLDLTDCETEEQRQQALQDPLDAEGIP